MLRIILEIITQGNSTGKIFLYQMIIPFKDASAACDGQIIKKAITLIEVKTNNNFFPREF